ncbi:MAG: hypothetical protein Q9182_004065 [Xanthomendoza sp. 2 TL-2023]
MPRLLPKYDRDTLERSSSDLTELLDSDHHTPDHQRITVLWRRRYALPKSLDGVFLGTKRSFASIYDKGGHLVNGAWGNALLNLVDLLGDANVFLSRYENDAGDKAEDAINNFKARVPCPNEIFFDPHVSLETFTSVVMPDVSERIKRIAYLAEIRNRALRPLDESGSVKYDRLLFLNDVVFDPIEAVQLLFSTNSKKSGQSTYLAACAVDFINPFKFYDTFATRDA